MLLPSLVFAFGIIVAYLIGGPSQALLVAELAVFEVVLSVNNAVINASVLGRMTRKWQNVFLTLGFLIAVAGMRLFFPIAIVVVTAGISFGNVIHLALHDPTQYADKLNLAHPVIAAFGSVFLFLLFLDFVIDEDKKVHWIDAIERPLSKAGRLKTLSIFVTLVLLGIASLTLGGANSARVFTAGVIGVIVYLFVRLLSELFLRLGTDRATVAVGKAAVMLFIYLEVLDASFSLDSVVGAFAISTNVLTIALGLGIGAFFVREMTILLVRKKTLTRYIYLEHGAQYSVGVLAILLAFGLAYNIPGALTGLIGVAVIGLALMSSIRKRQRA